MGLQIPFKAQPKWYLMQCGVLSLVFAISGCASSGGLPDNLQNTGLRPATHPMRVVAMSSIAFDELLALGITPIAAPKKFASYLNIPREKLNTIEDVSWVSPDIERLLALKPDLIVGQNSDPLLSKVAPVISISSLEHPDWKERFNYVAKATGREEEAEQEMHAYEVHADRLRLELHNHKPRIIVMYSSGNTVSFPDQYQDTWRILGEIGITKLDIPKGHGPIFERNKNWTGLSLESIKELDCDAIFIVPAQFMGKEWSEEGYRRLLTEPLWNSLDVVKRGNVYQVGEYWFQGSPRSANRILSDIERDVLKLPAGE
jgi:iron complex transport system substrate-binding protein